LTGKQIGLRIDVDTYRGTRNGVPRLIELLHKTGIKASFFFTVGPDNMGRHVWRLLKPRFFMKMVKSRAASLYGWDILLRGTFWPGPVIGKRLSSVIRKTAEAGHEIGFHAWDHQQWQSKIDSFPEEKIHKTVQKGVRLLTKAAEKPPVSFAAPGWRATPSSLVATERFSFQYASDCRGESVFYPVVDGVRLTIPQVPVTLPTYDEWIGRDGVTNENYNDKLLEQLNPHGLNVLTIHAEVEGGIALSLFEQFVAGAMDRGYRFLPLGRLPELHREIPIGRMIAETVSGREGWVAVQSKL